MPNIAALITVAAVMFAVLGAITLIAHIYKLNNIKSKTVGFCAKPRKKQLRNRRIYAID